ncbi:hypothetical protein HDU97_000153 [Phlyctochytrium planicorne]|nr:hypothetical protein HDU97_000153 [Phlyctochytrium planicorne]
MSTTSQFWNSTNCGVGTLCIEKWDPIGTYSVWLIIAKGGISEGLLSLIITFIAMAILVLGFYIHNYHWAPTYTSKNPEEKVAFLTVSDGLQNGNVAVALAHGFLYGVTKKLDLSRATKDLMLGITIWVVVSVISSATQLSIHSVTAMEHTSVTLKKITIPALNLTTLANGQIPPLFMDETTSTKDNQTLTYPVPNHVNIGYALLSGIPQNVSAYAFTLDGSICSGQLFYDTTLRTQCFVDFTSCQSDSMTFQAMAEDSQNPKYRRILKDTGNTANFATMPQDLLNISNLIILKTNDSSFRTAVVNETKVRQKNISGVQLKYFLRSRGSTPFPKLTAIDVFDYDEEWLEPVNQTIIKNDTTTYPLPNRVKSEFNSVDYWQGTCTHSIQLCDVIIDDGKIQTTQNCTEKIFNCWEDYGGSTKLCQSTVGIGEIWRTNFMVSNTANLLCQTRTYEDSQVLLGQIIGRLGLAWSISSLPWDDFDSFGLSKDLLYDWKIEISDRFPTEAIAMDFLLFLALLILFAVSFAWSGQIIYTIRSPDSEASKALHERRQLWDCVYKYSEEAKETPIAHEGTQLLKPGSS